MVSPILLAQALPTASSGVDWLYQFTNNLTNLTTQNGGALTAFGLTELSAIALFTLISMVINRRSDELYAPADSLLSPAELLGQSISRSEFRT